MLRLPLSVLAIIALGAVVSCGGGDGAPSPAEPTPTPFATVFPQRPEGQLTMCVDTVEATRAFQVEAVERIGAAMVQVTQHSRYGQAYTSGKEPIIDSGCPAPPALWDPAALDVSPPRTLADVRGRIVDTPGYYREAVFVIQDDELEKLTEHYNWRFSGAEELVWTDVDVLSPTTYGLYLSPADLERTGFVVDQLEKAVGLEKDTDPVEPGYHPASDP